MTAPFGGMKSGKKGEMNREREPPCCTNENACKRHAEQDVVRNGVDRIWVVRTCVVTRRCATSGLWGKSLTGKRLRLVSPVLFPRATACFTGSRGLVFLPVLFDAVPEADVVRME